MKKTLATIICTSSLFFSPENYATKTSQEFEYATQIPIAPFLENPKGDFLRTRFDLTDINPNSDSFGDKIIVKTDGENYFKVEDQKMDPKTEYLIFNFWTSWCDYCFKEMPDLEKLNNSSEIEVYSFGLDGYRLFDDFYTKEKKSVKGHSEIAKSISLTMFGKMDETPDIGQIFLRSFHNIEERIDIYDAVEKYDLLPTVPITVITYKDGKIITAASGTHTSEEILYEIKKRK